MAAQTKGSCVWFYSDDGLIGLFAGGKFTVRSQPDRGGSQRGPGCRQAGAAAPPGLHALAMLGCFCLEKWIIQLLQQKVETHLDTRPLGCVGLQSPSRVCGSYCDGASRSGVNGRSRWGADILYKLCSNPLNLVNLVNAVISPLLPAVFTQTLRNRSDAYKLRTAKSQWRRHNGSWWAGGRQQQQNYTQSRRQKQNLGLSMKPVQSCETQLLFLNKRATQQHRQRGERVWYVHVCKPLPVSQQKRDVAPPAVGCREQRWADVGGCGAGLGQGRKWGALHGPITFNRCPTSL